MTVGGLAPTAPSDVAACGVCRSLLGGARGRSPRGSTCTIGARTTSGYSGTPLPKKLGIVGDVVFATFGDPPEFAAALGDIGDAVWQRSLLAPLDVVVTFVTSRAQLQRLWPRVTAPLTPAGASWVAWPKRTSGIATDLTEDVLREVLLPTGWVDNKVCAIDEHWSGLRFVLRQEHRRVRR